MLLGVDVGGTFTDAVLVTERGIVTVKAPTTPGDQSNGVIDAVQLVCDEAQVRAQDIARFVHGMTVATNALLEDNVAATCLLATEGFTDLEQLGRQARRSLYRLCVGHPPPLVAPEHRIAVPERTGPDEVLRPLDTETLASRLRPLDDVDAAAVCLLFGFRHPAHEQRVADICASYKADLHVSASHETAGVVREYERLATTIVDAALSPLLRSYLGRLTDRARALGLPDPEVMVSGGGVVSASTVARHASWAVLSGPAAGAVGAAWVAQRAGTPEVVCLDMGGTSCDICLASDGRVHESGEREIGGRTLALPMVDVQTVGAGGGSIAWQDAGGALRVGPRSAGADPGPASYGHGGTEPTVTDANLVLGYLSQDSPLAGDVHLDHEAARHAIEGLAQRLEMSVHDAAAGIFRVASTEMARAVRVTTVERGIDPRELALLTFGGAGPVHATAIADELGMSRVLVPRSSGVLSALGLLVSERRRDLVQSVLLAGAELTTAAIADVVWALAERGRSDLGAADADVRAAYDLRYQGQSFELTVGGDREPSTDDLRASFDGAHQRRYGYADPAAVLELVTVRVTVALPGADPPQLGTHPPTPAGKREVWFDGEPREASVFHGQPEEFAGPAILELGESTLVVPASWQGGTDAQGTTVLERA